MPSVSTAKQRSIFTGLATPRDLTKYALYHGVTDWSQVEQFNQFEGGYGFLNILSVPKCLSELRVISDEYGALVDNYVHFIQHAFKGISGFDDMTSETQELNNGNSNMQLITKVTRTSAGQFSMRYHEQHGRLISKVHELYLRGIKDPDTGVKTYNGLIKAGILEAGYENEVFSFLVYNTDNTVRTIEQAYLVVNAQITNSTLGEVSNFERGTYDWKEVDVQYNGISLTGALITQAAQKYLDYINDNTVWEQMKFGYAALSKMPEPANAPVHLINQQELSFK